MFFGNFELMLYIVLSLKLYAFIKAVQKYNLMYIDTDIISQMCLQFENSSQLVLLNTRQYPLCDFP